MVTIHGGYLIAFFIDFQLAEHNMVLRSPCADHVYDTFGSVCTGATHTLPINADYLITCQFRNRTGPGNERGFQFFGIEGGEHAVKRVMGRDASRKAEESAEPLLLAPQMTEAMAMNRMSSNIWALVRSTRGSVNSEKKENGLFIVFSLQK